HITAATRAGGEGEAPPQLRARVRRTILLCESEQRAAQDDRQDDDRLDPVLQDERDCGTENENQDERALELREQQSQRSKARRVVHMVGAVALQPRRRLAAGQSVVTGPKRLE